MSYIIIIYLLLSQGIGQTTQQQLAYQASYKENGTVVDAPLVQDDPRFPDDYGQNKVEMLETY